MFATPVLFRNSVQKLDETLSVETAIDKRTIPCIFVTDFALEINANTRSQLQVIRELDSWGY